MDSFLNMVFHFVPFSYFPFSVDSIDPIVAIIICYNLFKRCSKSHNAIAIWKVSLGKRAIDAKTNGIRHTVNEIKSTFKNFISTDFQNNSNNIFQICQPHAFLHHFVVKLVAQCSMSAFSVLFASDACCKVCEETISTGT